MSLIKKKDLNLDIAININTNKVSIAKKISYILIFIIIVAWSIRGTKFNLYEIRSGVDGIVDIFSRMFPPSLRSVSRLVRPTVETIQMSIVGTLLAIIISLVLGVFAARNISPHPLIYHFSRFILNALRSVPDVIFAIIFVSAVGLGPFPGTLAIGVSSSGMLGKFLGDSIENIDPGSIEALESTGANKIQTIVYSVIPNILPEFISLSLFRWEMNFRSSTILGIVGAGGIGFELMTSMRLFKYREMTTILIIILSIVALVDFISSFIRKKII